MRVGMILAALVLLVSSAVAQRFGFGFQGHDEGPDPRLSRTKANSIYSRRIHRSARISSRIRILSRNGRGNGWWPRTGPMPITTSLPASSGLTRVETGTPLHMSLTDDRLFDNPGFMPHKPAIGDWTMPKSRACGNTF